ncbi:MAG: sporulation protein YabP [Firmicutes bacterium]|nr:sporulation protein YabP [Bacillota bacterium]
MDDSKKKQQPAGMQHKIMLNEREMVSVDGVTNVESFDDQEVILETSAGVLLIHGKELHIKHLNLDDGNLEIEGYIHGLEYSDEGPGKKAKGLLGRLLK